MRVYLPATVPLLRGLLAAGELGDPPLTGFAVTDATRATYPDAEIDELEYLALTEAAHASLGLLAEDPLAPRRRAVLAADLPDDSVRPAPDTAAGVLVTCRVSRRDLASAHLDALEDLALVDQAVRVRDPGALEDVELLWFGIQELFGEIGSEP